MAAPAEGTFDAALDPVRCYAAVASRDRRFDGVFLTAVRTTGIYCRPSCPARTPAAENVTFHRTAASAQAAGYRACRRCAPDATPGEPGWDVVADVAGRAMRLIADGVVDRDGVEGLAARLGYTSRHLNRLLVEHLGAPALALARARRAQHARTLLTETDLDAADVAFAAGFGSVRQFNDTVREVYAATPRELRGRAGATSGPAGRIRVTVPVRTPFAGPELLAFLATRAVAGVEVVSGTTYARTLDLPHAPGTVEIDLPRLEAGTRGLLTAWFTLGDLRDLGAATERVRRLLDADCDPVAVDAHLGADPLLAPSVAAVPGLRVPGHVDGCEVAVRAVLGQQVTVAAARTQASRLVATYGRPVETTVAGLGRLFPSADVVAGLDHGALAMPGARARALTTLASLVAGGELHLDRGEERAAVRERLLAVPGVGPWTADYVAMRALGDPDRFLPKDTGTRDALRRLGVDPARAGEISQRWAPWRSYAQLRLWQSLTSPATASTEREE
ncbi:AlkA N-terminal domain-containing protein [Nocardioides daphniae]|uniref:DNA-3-methyladenine glycosylase II n=1 Tax=Nocardioides daphniae TaxID=402297 RepID=A0A4P7U9T2_9ACTN|nr:AlkA N-terminal domain-containing protein [Nocardioides daphniae]QCC76883.1 DNA-3-methyladenine glycosylase 2 family protein [Nocardioides daphniae]GGD17364.1 DNA-3-methyladenine glycosylase [Nocardioides daphniae]